MFGLPCFRVLGVESLAARHQGLEDGSALRQQEEGKGMGQEGIRNLNKECQEERWLSEMPGTLSQCCFRKGLWLVHYIVVGFPCYSAGGFGKSHKMPGGRVSINELKPFVFRGV